MKSVCVVGAGPAGLVAAKTLLQTGHFSVRVYEKNDRIGGIWALDRHTPDGFLSPATPTNLSRFTVSFSDLDWNAVDLDLPSTIANGQRDPCPMFPKAWMANRYLEEYRKRYIPQDAIECGRSVLKVKRDFDRWVVTSQETRGGESRTEFFGYLIVASGFFSQPRALAQTVPSLANSPSALPVKAIHTSAFRTLDDLFPDAAMRGKNILILGGGNSSGETAAAVAFQLSDARWSPAMLTGNKYKDCRITHVTPRPIYPIPPFVEYEAGSRSYVPIDFRLYDFSKRPKDLPSYGGKQSMDVRNVVHGALQTMVGGDLSDISSSLVSRKGEGRGSVYVALSENYAEYVRSGAIEVVAGRVTDVKAAASGAATVVVKNGNDTFSVEDVAAIIYATGYSPASALNVLDEETKSAIDFDGQSLRLPIILEQWQTMSQAVPNIAFLGFYEGPYWPMMEMQARLTAERWSSGKVAVQKPFEQKQELLRLRQSMFDRGLDIPQYWFGDYLGYLKDIAQELDLEHNDQDFAEREGCTSPARYVSKYTDRAEAEAIMQDLYKTWKDCTIRGRYVPRAAFRALQGQWNIHRTIKSANTMFPSGELQGKASFHPRQPSQDKSGKVFDLEYLYIESGTFTLANGATMSTRRRYVYRYSEEDDKLSVWFVKPDNDLKVDYLFHDLSFVEPKVAKEHGALIATGDHLCVKDMYETEYSLPMRGVSLRDFKITHTVRGPDKDYVSTTQYSRCPA